MKQSSKCTHVLTCLLLATCPLAACGGSAPASSAAAPAAKVEAPVKEADLTRITLSPEAVTRLGIKTVAAERKAVTKTRTVGGEVIPQPGAETVVTAPFAGTVEATGALPAPGANVEKGRSLFRLVPLAPAERDSAVDAERAVGEASARQELAARRVARAETLVKDGAGSRRAVEEAQAELGGANAELKAARDRLALARRGTSAEGGLSIVAPESGILRTVLVRSGQSVAAGAPLFHVVRLDTVWIRVPLYVGETEDIDTGAAARLVPLGSPAEADGVVARPVPAPPSADPSTAAVDLYFAITNANARFRPGQRVGMRLVRRAEAVSLVVPAAALLHDAFGGTWVYEARAPQVFVRRRVDVTDLVGPLAVLARGPEPGTQVVTDGAAELFGTEFGVGK